MKKTYDPPLVEQWVTDKFIKADIMQPSDLEPERVSKVFGIDYSMWPGITCSYRDNRGETYIMEHTTPYDVHHRDDFFHELGHILRHSGDQFDMPQSLREYQEWDANLFALYAAVPFHMINFEKGYTVLSIMNEFQVSKHLAMRRIDDIRQKTYWEQKHQQERYKPIYTPFALKNCTDETKRIMRQLSKQTGMKFT